MWVRGERKNPMAGPLLSSCVPQQWCFVSLVGPNLFLDSLVVVCYTLAPSGCLHTANPRLLPMVWPPKTKLQYPTPTCPSGWADKHFRLASAVQLWPSVQVSLHFALHTCCCTLLWGYKVPPLSLPVKGLPSVWKPFLCHSSHPVAQIPSRFFSFLLFFSFFFCPTQLCGNFLALLEVWGLLPAFSRCSVRVFPHVDVFLIYLWGDELHVLLLCHLDHIYEDMFYSLEFRRLLILHPMSNPLSDTYFQVFVQLVNK